MSRRALMFLDLVFILIGVLPLFAAPASAPCLRKP